MSAAPVGLTRADGVATIRLMRGDAGNAMDWPLVDAFSDAVETVAADRTIRAVLIVGDGANFCVGGDLRAFAAEADGPAFIARIADRLHKAIALLAGLDAPVVAAVQGAAAGAGLSLVAIADLAVATRTARFTMAYGAVGLVADGGASWLLPRLIGLRLAQEMAFTNRSLTAAEALDHSLVTRVVDEDDLAAEAERLVATIAAGPTFAHGQVKRLFAESFAATLPDQLRAEATAMVRAIATEDASGAIRAFIDRRRPRFDGAPPRDII